MYEYLATLYPKGIRDNIFKQFDYFDLRIRKEFVVGSIMFFTLGVSLAIALQVARYMFPAMSPLLALTLVFLGLFLILQLVVYNIISLMASNRAEFIESILPLNSLK